jgi:streptomycin 6-kinase
MSQDRLDLPEDFVRTVTLTFDGGAEWLRCLPELLAECEQRWDLKLGPPFNLSYNYAAPAVRADGTEVVLKAGVPHKELNTELLALQIYDGRSCARLLDSDAEKGILLLERLKPGAMLITEPDDEKATAIAAGVMRNLWRPVPAQNPFPTVEKWAEGMVRLRIHFNGGTGPIPSHLVEQAERLFAELLPSQAAPVLLHGDLHHFNILSAEREPWLAIDPKGIVGEPAYEIGAWMRNPLSEILQVPNPARVLARRLDLFAAEWNLDRARLRGWTIAQAVLSAWWGIEDGDTVDEDFLALTELFAALPE